MLQRSRILVGGFLTTPAHAAAPGSDLAASASPYADGEAVEDFAEAPPDGTCQPLAADPQLDRADDKVRAFREQSAGVPRS